MNKHVANYSDKSFFFKKAEHVAADLLKRAVVTDCSIYWETLSETADELYYKSSTDLYSGNTGIALFWCELYHLTNKDNYKTIFLKCLHHINSTYNAETSQGPSLYFGNSGLIYLYCRAAVILKDADYFKKALTIADDIVNFLGQAEISKDLPNELTGGISGIIWAFTLLYHYTGISTLVNSIKTLVDRLLENVNVDKNGCFWDREYNQIKGLSGVAHGASGIAHVLNEVGLYFNSSGLVYLSSLTTGYEDAHYNKKIRNWPDFRLGIYNAQFKKDLIAAFWRNDLRIFEQGNYLNAWCHGAPGIGLVRLYQKKRNNKDNNDAKLRDIANEILTQLNDVQKTLTLCHGIGSGVEFLIEYSATFNDLGYLKLVETALEDYYKYNINEDDLYRSGFEGSGLIDNSLMNGIAGIGYMMLRLIDNNVPSLLLPQIPYTIAGQRDQISLFEQKYSKNYICNFITEKLFPQTSKIVRSLIGAEMVSVSDLYDKRNGMIQLKSSIPKKLNSFLKQHVKDSLQLKYILFTVKVENLLRNNDFNIKSHIYLAVRDLAIRELIEVNPNKLPSSMMFSIPVTSKLVKSIFRYAESTENSDRQKMTTYYIIYNTWSGAKIAELQTFAYLLCRYLKSPRQINEIVDHLEQQMSNSDVDKVQLEHLVNNQLLQLINYGLLDCST